MKVWTRQIVACPYCFCVAKEMMDDDGNRYCGKCKRKIVKIRKNCEKSVLTSDHNVRR